MDIESPPSLFEVDDSVIIDDLLQKIANYIGRKLASSQLTEKIVGHSVYTVIQSTMLFHSNSSIGEKLNHITYIDHSWKFKIKLLLLTVIGRIIFYECNLWEERNLQLIPSRAQFLLKLLYDKVKRGIYLFDILFFVGYILKKCKWTSTRHYLVHAEHRLLKAHDQGPFSWLHAGTTALLFVIQFLHWWRLEDISRDLDRDYVMVAVPPPPPDHTDKTDNTKGRCPICLQEFVIPTVCIVSGFVYCFTCISQHVRNRGTCFVRGSPCSNNELVRLFEMN